jgi:hypothetical protein
VSAPGRFDRYAILSALEHHRVNYVLIGAFARVLQGTEELTRGLDLVPSLRAENLRRLQLALDELDAKREDGRSLALDPATVRDEPVISVLTPYGGMKLVPDPPGTRGGYDDLRRAATREPIGRGLRPSVASISDLARLLATLNREQDQPLLLQLRKLREIELSLDRGIELDRGMDI